MSGASPSGSPDQTLLAIRQCRYSVPGANGPRLLLDIPGFSVTRGEQVAIVGPSGTGKSTLLHLLAGLLSPEAGEVEVDGVRLDLLSEAGRDAFRAHRIGLVFQAFNLFQGLPVIDNLLLAGTLAGKTIRREDAMEVLSQVGLADQAGQDPARLSIGEQQRVAAARAVIHSPPILLADEPTASLDPTNARNTMDLFLRLAATKGCTLVVVSHDPATMDRVGRRVSIFDLNRATAEPGRKGG